MADTWYVVADGARAEVLRQGRRGFMTVFHLAHEHPRSSELVRDRAGRVGDRVGGHRHAMEPNTDPHRHLKTLFVRALAARLEEAVERQECDDLVLVADPRTLGQLRAVLAPPAQRAISEEVGKDLTGLGIKDLHRALLEIGHAAAHEARP